jgi:hypothetical protein
MSKFPIYTESELQQLAHFPGMVGMASFLVGHSGIIGQAQELGAILSERIEAVQIYPDNVLIQKLTVADIWSSAWTTIVDWFQSIRGNHKEAIQQSITQASEIAELLAKKSPPREAEEYKEWVLGIAARVALAAKESDNQNENKNSNVNPAEEDFLTKMREALRLK